MNTGFTTGLVEGSFEDSDFDDEGGSFEESEDAVLDSEGEDTFLEDLTQTPRVKIPSWKT